MMMWSSEIVRELACAVVTRVFDEDVPADAKCAQDWREWRLKEALAEAFTQEKP